VSYSWVDPHFVSRFERREELRLTDRLARRALTRECGELDPGAARCSQAGGLECDLPGRAHLRLL
jgi:hypothetical protein